MILAALALSLVTAPPSTRPLVPGGTLRDLLAGGESTVFSIDVPANTAARIVVRPEGIDVAVTLRRAGSDLPQHGLDMTAGETGEELVYPPIGAAQASFNIFVRAALPRSPRASFSISFELGPADDRARAIAAARQLHQQASDASWVGTADSYRRSRELYAEAARDAAGIDPPQAAEASYQCARAYDALGDTSTAIEWQQRAFAQFRALGRVDRQARALDRLGDLSRKIGEVLESERYFTQALPLAREAHDEEAIADILNNSGLLMLSFGRAEEAIEQLQAALPLAREINSDNVEAALHFNIADSYRSLGLTDRAIAEQLRSLEVIRRIGILRRIGRNEQALAGMYEERGDFALALTTMEDAYRHYETSGDTTGFAQTMHDYGVLLYRKGEHARAIELYTRALPILHAAHSPGSEAATLRSLAIADIDANDPEAAIEKARESVRLSREMASPFYIADSLFVQAYAERAANRLPEAIESIRGCIEQVEAQRGAIISTDFRRSFLSAVRGYYDLYVDLLQQSHQPAAAFEVSERGLARTLLEGLAESSAKIRKGVDPELLARQRDVQTQLNAKARYRSQVATSAGGASPRVQAVGREIDRLVDQLKEIEARIRASSPAYRALEMPEPISAERVQTTLLDARSALVEYHLGPKGGYVWVIDQQSITVHDLPPIAEVERVARRYHELLSRSVDGLPPAERAARATETAAVARQVAAMVWTPIESRVRGKRLLIVPDGVLQYVPFAALPGTRGQPLLVEHEIAYLPSASVLEEIRQRSRPVRADASIAVFADPVFSKEDGRLQAARAVSGDVRQSASRGEERSHDQAVHDEPVAADEEALRDGGPFVRLRFSRTEADSIREASPSAFEALDFDAAKRNVLTRDLKRYRILHFATHGSLDSAHPELSGLVLSLVDQSGKSIDGFLRLHEIYNLDLDADLVVLSACRTALGQEVHGEGLVGLTRGFMYAGAARVVSSVWNVDDRASAELMARFYHALLTEHLSPASALRAAQLSMLREPRWSNPHYWAAFGLQGEWR